MVQDVDQINALIENIYQILANAYHANNMREHKGTVCGVDQIIVNQDKS